MRPYYCAVDEAAVEDKWCVMQHYGLGQVRIVARCPTENWQLTICKLLNAAVRFQSELSQLPMSLHG